MQNCLDCVLSDATSPQPARTVATKQRAQLHSGPPACLVPADMFRFPLAHRTATPTRHAVRCCLRLGCDNLKHARLSCSICGVAIDIRQTQCCTDSRARVRLHQDLKGPDARAAAHTASNVTRVI